MRFDEEKQRQLNLFEADPLKRVNAAALIAIHDAIKALPDEETPVNALLGFAA